MCAAHSDPKGVKYNQECAQRIPKKNVRSTFRPQGGQIQPRMCAAHSQKECAQHIQTPRGSNTTKNVRSAFPKRMCAAHSDPKGVKYNQECAQHIPYNETHHP